MVSSTAIDLFNYKPEDGGVLDIWQDTAAENWLYDAESKEWLHWLDDTHWERDRVLRFHCQLQKLFKSLNEYARSSLMALPPKPTGKGEVDDDEVERNLYVAWINATKRSDARVNSVAGLAEPHRSRPSSLFDKRNLLNFRNGALDLDTLTFRGHCKDDLCTYALPYDYDAGALCPRWELFCREVLVYENPDSLGDWQTDEELVCLLQEGFGLSLTNETRHEAMFWPWGKPNSGKSTIGHVLQMLLGDLALSVNFNTLGGPGDRMIAEVPGKRVLYSSESRKGGRFAEGIVKSLVTGDMVPAERKWGHPFTFRSAAKIWWMMNDAPVISDTSGSIERRLQLIPFHRMFSKEERDVFLIDKLSAEIPGILNWAIEGLQRLRTRGRLPEPKAVREAIATYMMENNPVAQWLAECATEPDAQGVRIAYDGSLLWTSATDCYNSYSPWASRNGRQPMNMTNFGKELKKLVKYRVPKNVEYQLGLVVP